MRRSVSILVAAAMVAASAAAIAPAQAAAIRTAPAIAADASAKSGIVEVRDRFRHRRHHRRHYSSRRHRVAPFFYGFPFAFAPHYYQYQPRYRDCFRTFDGRVYCRR